MYLRQQRYVRIEATQEASEAWVQRVADIFSKSLLGRAKSFYTGANVPGKRIEPLNFTGGLPLYNTLIQRSARDEYAGFELTSSTSTKVKPIHTLSE